MTERKEYVVVVGNLFSVKTIHGPFKDHSKAYEWGSLECWNQHWEIVPILTPVYTSRSWGAGRRDNG